jgi:hypothetical protein
VLLVEFAPGEEWSAEMFVDVTNAKL